MAFGIWADWVLEGVSSGVFPALRGDLTPNPRVATCRRDFNLWLEGSLV